MLTHADQLPQHPVQMPGQPRRLYLAGALASIIGTPIAVAAIALWLSVSNTVYITAVVLAGGSIAVGKYLMRAAMWHVRTKDLDLPLWPEWVRLGLETSLVLAVVVISTRSGSPAIQLAWVMLAAMSAAGALCSILGWALTMAPQPRWLVAFPRAQTRDAAQSVLRFTLVAVLFGGTAWMLYDDASITEWAVSAAQSAGWSQQVIDAIPEANYWILFVKIGAAVGTLAMLTGWMMRISRSMSKPEAR